VRITAKKKTMIIISSVAFALLLAATAFWWFVFQYGTAVNTSSIAISHSEFNEGKVWVEGSIMDSASAFSGYSYKKVGTTGYITLRCVIVNGAHTSGEFSASSNSGDELDKLYIQGADQKTILAWSK
jgi:hypothetical protein